MTKTVKLVLGRLAFIAALAGLGQAAYAAGNQAPPSAGAAGLAPRVNLTDGNGVVNQDPTVNWGYHVFESTASSTAALMFDIDNSTPTAGVVHQVCMGQGPGVAVFGDIYDSSSTTGGTYLAGFGHLMPTLWSSSTGITCQVIDAEFNNGVVVKTSSTQGIYLYFRPAGRRFN